MSAATRRWLVGLAVVAGAASLLTLAGLPPAALRLPAPEAAGSVRTWKGAVHVHSTRSDGAGTVEDIARAARTAGLQFVVLADHGDGTRTPAPPAYVDGVLCVTGVEISTRDGHYVALGLPQSPYRLAGDARDVVEDVARLGGIGIAAHPQSPKPELAWSDWSLPFDGVEWFNADSAWRDEPAWRLAAALLAYPWRPAEALLSVSERPDRALAEWETIGRQRPVFGLAASDAHARIGPRVDGDGADFVRGVSLNVPSYEAVFQAFSNHVRLPAPPTGDAATDAARLLDALSSGGSYAVFDGFATPVAFDFAATRPGAPPVEMGESLVQDRPITLTADGTLPDTATIRLLKDGQVALDARGRSARLDVTEPGVYRVEVYLSTPDRTMPWIVTNPIFVRPVGWTAVAAAPAHRVSEEGVTLRELYVDGTAEGWALEHDEVTKAAIDATPTPDGRELAFRFGLAKETPAPPWAALALGQDPVPPGADRLRFVGRARSPMRVSVQLRAPGVPENRRWERSIYLDGAPRTITIPFDEMRAVGRPPDHPVDAGAVDALLFVVDTTHTPPGTSGIVWLDEVVLLGSAP